MQARQCNTGAIDDEAKRELGDIGALDVLGAPGAPDGRHGSGGVAYSALGGLSRSGGRSSGQRLVLDQRREPGHADGDALEGGSVEIVAVVARSKADAGAEPACQGTAGERSAREDGELAGGGGFEQRLGAAIAEVIDDRDRRQPGLGDERGCGLVIGLVDECAPGEDLAFADQPRAGSDELGPRGRGQPRRPQWELGERQGIEPGGAQRGLDAILDIERRQTLAQQVAVRRAGAFLDEGDPGRDDHAVAGALRADAETCELLAVGLGGNVEQRDAKGDRFVQRVLDVTGENAAIGRGREAEIAAADRADGGVAKPPGSHGGNGRSVRALGGRQVGYHRAMPRWGLLSIVLACAGVAGGGGCNEDGKLGHLPDARPVDGPLVEDPPPPVIVTVTRDGSPAMGRTVYFQSADSSLVAEIMTGTDGRASALMGNGGFVTVIEPEPGVAVISTFAGVRSGDQLHLDLAPPASTPPITFTLSVPNEAVDNTYTLYSSCGQADLGIGHRLSGGVAVAVPVEQPVTLSGCNGTADMLVVSTDAGGQIVGWLYRTGIAVAQGVPRALAGEYEPATEMSFTYTSVPARVGSLDVRRELRSARGKLFTSKSFPATVDKATSTAVTKITVPTPPNVQGITTAVDQSTTGHGQQTFVEWGAAASGPYSLDYGLVALRGYDAYASFDPANRAILWTETDGGIEPSFVLGQYHAQRDDATEVNHWVWRIVAPYVAHQPKLSVPRLPTTIYDFNARVDDQALVDRLTAMRVQGGYEAARPHAFADLPVELLGATGRIVLENLFTP